MGRIVRNGGRGHAGPLAGVPALAARQGRQGGRGQIGVHVRPVQHRVPLHLAPHGPDGVFQEGGRGRQGQGLSGQLRPQRLAHGREIDQARQALHVSRLGRRPDGEEANGRRGEKGHGRGHDRQDQKIAEQSFHEASPTLEPIMHGLRDDAMKSPAGSFRRGFILVCPTALRAA